MSIKTTIENAVLHALKNHEEEMVMTLRMLLSAIRNREIEKRTRLSKTAGTNDLDTGSRLDDDEVTDVIHSEVKKRRDAIQEFEKGGRKDLAEKEARELSMLEAYIPPELDDAQIEKIVQEVVGLFGVATQKDFGRVMGEAMKKVGRGASGERVSRAVKKMLQG